MVSKSSRLIRHDICKQELQDLGARVLDVSDMMTYVVFDLVQTTVAYIYNVSPEEDKFHFERAKPYAMDIGIYDNESEIVDAISRDIEQFTMAMQSSNFSRFVEIDSTISKTVRTFEDLYLYYNVDSDSLDEISAAFDNVIKVIHDIKDQSERVYFKSEPFSFSESK